jgi:hypothetical protein
MFGQVTEKQHLSRRKIPAQKNFFYKYDKLKSWAKNAQLSQSD